MARNHKHLGYPDVQEGSGFGFGNKQLIFMRTVVPMKEAFIFCHKTEMGGIPSVLKLMRQL